MNIEEIKKVFDNCEIVNEKICVKSDIFRLLDFIKNNYGFDILKEIIAVDKQTDGIELIYKLFSTSDEEEALISITVIDEVESVSKIFDSAIADEKEIYDLFGVKFIGNNELKRLYMPESWDGHPLKKNYEEKDERLNWND